MEIKWTDHDPLSGEKRYLRAVRFAGFWKFQYRSTRRGIWTRLHPPSLDMWEIVLDALQRRYRRREGVSDEDIQQVARIIHELRARLEPEE